MATSESTVVWRAPDRLLFRAVDGVLLESDLRGAFCRASLFSLLVLGCFHFEWRLFISDPFVGWSFAFWAALFPLLLLVFPFRWIAKLDRTRFEVSAAGFSVASSRVPLVLGWDQIARWNCVTDCSMNDQTVLIQTVGNVFKAIPLEASGSSLQVLSFFQQHCAPDPTLTLENVPKPYDGLNTFLIERAVPLYAVSLIWGHVLAYLIAFLAYNSRGAINPFWGLGLNVVIGPPGIYLSYLIHRYLKLNTQDIVRVVLISNLLTSAISFPFLFIFLISLSFP